MRCGSMARSLAPISSSRSLVTVAVSKVLWRGGLGVGNRLVAFR